MDSSQSNSPYNPFTQAPPPSASSQSTDQSLSNQSGLASFGSLSAPGSQASQQQSQSQSQSQQQQQQPSPSHPTLPPLQSSNAGFAQFGSLGYGQLGSQPQSSNGPHAPSANYNAFPHLQSSSSSTAMLPPTFSNNPFAMSQPMMYSAPTTTSMASSSSIRPAILPMPPGGVGGAGTGLPSLAANGPSGLGQMGQQAGFLPNEEAPTHVVGSQGRRGILPSAPGRPNPPSQGGVQSSKSLIPQKDAEGKFPCPHCSKTYLHAKHLKRHLLRHTGDRPYECPLCKDTFSRSDILKRHFQKCAIRRGNPTGTNHLAHQRRNTTSGNRLSISQHDGPIGLASLPEIAGQSQFNNGVVSSSPTVNGDMSARSSRTNSLITPGSMSHRNSLAGLGILGPNAPNGEPMGSSAPFQPGMSTFAMQNAANGAHMPSNFAFNQQPSLNGNAFNNTNNAQQMSFLGLQGSRFTNSQHDNNPQINETHQLQPAHPAQNANGDGSGSQIDWTRMFTQGGQDGFIGSQPVNASSQALSNIKTEPDSKHDFHLPNDFSNDSFLGSLYSHPGAFGGEDTDHGIFGLASWCMDDPLQVKVDSLMQHCFPDGTDVVKDDPAADLIQMCLKLDNVKHFAEYYTSWHGHWPLLHMPTFKLTEANNNLVLVILCIGAVYSPKLNVLQVRQMMEFVKATVLKNCTIYSLASNGQSHNLGNNSLEVEELQALAMLQTMFTWHGNPAQREAARNEFPTLVQIAQAMQLVATASPGHYAYSPLHSPIPDQVKFDVSEWNWHGWLEQEKRNRLMYHLLVTDASLVMYFNSPPQLDPLDVSLMLPADDAAWDASSAQDCANALGLNGIMAQNKNTTGTRRPQQPTLSDALRLLLDPLASVQPGATNVHAKFLIIHALIVGIVACQKAVLQSDNQGSANAFGCNGSTPATPLSQNDWLEQHSGSSGRGTPTDGLNSATNFSLVAQHEKKRLGQALEKWKRNWDNDMEIQYPPSRFQQRRFGFIRDGVHFFYLGRSFLQSQQASDWSLPADTRFKRVMALLKRIKGMVIGDTESKGHDQGSVGDIDDQYGLDTLTLDMKLLFKPYDSQFDSPVTGVQTHSLL